MKVCECGRTATCETSDGVVRCIHCCEDDNACEIIRCGCEWCGEEDSETANGCSLCLECTHSMQECRRIRVDATAPPTAADAGYVDAACNSEGHIWSPSVDLGMSGFDGGDAVAMRPAEARRLATLLLVLADLAEEPQ